MPEVQVRDIPLGDTPVGRVTKGSERMVVLVVDATFDGSGAAAGFVPAVQIISDAGEEVGTFPASDTVAAGGSAAVTFAPFLSGEGGGIKFGVDNLGTWLHIFTDNIFGIIIEDDGGGGILLAAAGLTKIIADGGFQLDCTGLALLEAGSFISNADSWEIRTQAAGTALESTGPITIETTGGSDKITLRVPVGASVEVQDHAQNPIFRVDEDGDLHGKTGKALVFDL